MHPTGPSRAYDALFDVSLPRFVVPNAAFCLFASQLHFLGYVIDSLGPILFLIEAVTRRSEEYLYAVAHSAFTSSVA